MPSDLQVSNIRDLTNANSAISIASDGQVTISQNNPTLTLGSNATFPGKSANSGNTIAGGHILQCQFKKKTDAFSGNGSSGHTPYAVTGLDCKITPTDANSRIIIIYHVFMGNSDAINHNFYHALYKSATGITDGYIGVGSNSSSGGFNNYTNGANMFQGGAVVINMDTAGTTNEITYQPYIGANNSIPTVYVNRNGASSSVIGTSEIICMEVSNG